jgi:hypothetical protein
MSEARERRMEELLREVRSTWVVMRAADEIPKAKGWCDRVDALLSEPVEKDGE